MHIYAQSLIKLSIAAVFACVIWGAICCKYNKGRFEKAFKALSMVLVIASLYIILSHTMIGRV